MGNWYRVLFFLVLLSATFRSRADSIPDAVEAALICRGYENITVFIHSDTLFVGAENRLYRWDPGACADIIGVVMPLAGPNATLCLAVLRRGIPVVMVTLPRRAWEEAKNGTLDAQSFGSSLTTRMEISSSRRWSFTRDGKNPTFNKIDFVIYPQVKIQLGNFDDPFKSQFNIAPAAEISFVRGMYLIAQVIIPLQNDLEPNGNSIRPGVIALSQTFRLPFNFFGNVAAGYFTRNRYGFHTEVKKYFLNGKVTLGFTGGLTGYAEMVDRQWNYTGIDLFTWFADATYRWARYDLTLKAGYGNFLDGGTGWRADVSRQFREVTVGFFALGTGDFLNGGFFFRVPIPPRRYSTKHMVRVRPESYFPWEYRARGLSEAGRSYSPGTTLTDLFHNINPDYLHQNIVNSLYQDFLKSEKK